MKKLAGKTDIEDALQKLENAILEEVRMAAVEALRHIYGLHDRMKDLEDMLKDVRDTLKCFDERMKHIRIIGLNSA